MGVNVKVLLTARAGDPAGRGSGESVTEVAFAVVHVSVTLVPVITPPDDDENELMLGGGVGGGGGGGVDVAAPAPPQAVKKVMSSPREVRSSSLKTTADLCTGRRGPCSTLLHSKRELLSGVARQQHSSATTCDECDIP